MKSSIIMSSFLNANLIEIKKENFYENFQVQYHKDETSKLSINNISKIEFNKSTKNNFNIGYSKGHVWFKFEVSNTSKNKEFILSLNEIFYETANLYYLDNNKWIKDSSSLFNTIEDREIKSNHLAFYLNLPSNTKRVYYLELKAKYAYFGKLGIYEKNYFYFKNSFGINILYTFVLGIILTLIIFTTFLYAKTKEKIYLYYFNYCLFNFIYFANISGLLVYIDLQKYIYELQLAPAFMIGFLVLFSREYLETKKYLPKFDSILKYLSIPFFIFGIMVLFEYQPWNKFINNFSGLMGIILIIISIIIYFKGHQKTKYYIYAIVLYFIFIFMFAFMVNGTLEYTYFTRYGVAVANAIEMVVFSIILANRYFEMKENINRYLKSEVDKRTFELDNILKERELLLKEIYHRVKNNFHMIIGMLHLENEKNKSTKHNLIELINRVKSMSLIHEYLYKSKDLSNITIKDYLEKIIHNLQTTYPNIKITCYLENLIISIDDSISLGIILNEVLTNSIKHNKNYESILIDIKLFKHKNKVLLIVQDNGKGFDIEKEQGLGLKLIKQFSNKLKTSNSHFLNENGTKYELTFEKRT